MSMPDGAVIEILERTNQDDPKGIVPNEIRINGQVLLCPEDAPIIVHETTLRRGELVRVTLTLFARRVRIDSEPRMVDR